MDLRNMLLIVPMRPNLPPSPWPDVLLPLNCLVSIAGPSQLARSRVRGIVIATAAHTALSTAC